MMRTRIQILYEYGEDLRPHGSAYLRLLRPFTYPQIREKFFVTFSRELNQGEANDIVIADRLWNNDINPHKVLDLSNKVHHQGGKLMYSFDDNFLEIEANSTKKLTKTQKGSFLAFLEQSDAFVVTTPALETSLMEYGKPVYVVPNVLDDRLIVQKPFLEKQSRDKVVIGYMGTGTHDDDLRMILPAFQAVHEKYPDRVIFQIIGALNEAKLRRWDELNRLPVSILEPLPVEIEYPPFMLWFTGQVEWDIAVAPLVNSTFNQFKSDIKFLDYTAAGIPGVYSQGNAYSSSVEDRKTGLLVENDPLAWVSALDEMVQNEKLRKNLLNNAKNYLFTTRVLSQCRDVWINTINDFVENHTDV